MVVVEEVKFLAIGGARNFHRASDAANRRVAVGEGV